jgi:poly-beta-hydroxyalkanoate depolymerase
MSDYGPQKHIDVQQQIRFNKTFFVQKRCRREMHFSGFRRFAQFWHKFRAPEDIILLFAEEPGHHTGIIKSRVVSRQLLRQRSIFRAEQPPPSIIIDWALKD